MQITSSDFKMKQVTEKAKLYFEGRTTVSRQEILDFQEKTGNRFPTKFWDASRVGRGMFTLDVPEQPERPVVVHAPTAATPNTVISKFDKNNLIPKVKDTFVQWGNYKTVETLLKTNKFFTLYITGDSGCGKNEMVAQACAKTNRPIVRVSCTRDTKEEHLIGTNTLHNGTIVYEEGPVVWAAKNGAVLLLDEISSLDANSALCLQTVLEGNEFFVKSANMQVVPTDGFCIIATDNTKGRGSDSGRYIGTNVLNDAFLERFEMTVEQGYPTEKVERQIIERLMDSIGLKDDEFVNKLITWVHAIRKTYMEDGLEEHVTTRRACHIVKVYQKLGKADTAVELCVNRFDETTKMAMVSLWNKLTPEEKQPE